MKLYLVSRTDEVRYDQFFGFVVAAENEQSALTKFHPRGRDFEEDDFFEDGEVYEWTAKENLKVEYLGESNSPVEKVILASFNAG